ncbi:hypothetical protein LJR219_004761 [Phenylobacterium sp. LjRoot219]
MAWSARADRDFAGALLLFTLGQRQGEHAVVELGPDVLRLYGIRDLNRSLERAVGALNVVVALLFAAMLLFELLLSADRQHIAVQGELDVLFVDAGQFGADPQLPVGLGNIHPGLKDTAGLLLRGSRRSAEAPEGVIKQAVHLSLKREEWISSIRAAKR